MSDAAKPIRTRIVDDVVETLAQVTTAAAYGGNLIVERPTPLGNRLRDNLVLVVGGNPQRVEDEAQNFIGWTMPVHCVYSARESESSETSIDERLDIAAADIEKALTQDDSNTRGGLAIDTEIGDVDFGNADLSGMSGQVVVTVMVYFRHLYGDPYSQS